MIEAQYPGEYVATGDELDVIRRHIHLMRAMNRPVNILLTGDAGIAKTTLALYLGHLTHTPVYLLNMHGDVRDDQLLGTVTADLGWVDGAVPRAMRSGAILALEEVNMARPDTLAVLHGVLADTRFIELTDCPDPALRLVRAHPDFIVVGTMNEGAGFSGVKAMNTAFRSRWSLVLRLTELPADKLAA
ncbi:AAA family ATPase, partial [Methylacidiphilum caldifontis]|uniref:AAA family ATPase n=1 Tax=Methylacidiphilum caldifontis TaxID=2795386 RepID=UPI00141B19BC